MATGKLVRLRVCTLRRNLVSGIRVGGRGMRAGETRRIDRPRASF